jgi:pimeloyl-ACP methyl ester carboxylesterase
VSRFATTVTYDHAGYNASQPGPPPRNARQIARELREMLRRTGVPPPYLLVGYSFGGPCVRVFASLYPQEIAGMVLVDPTQEDFMEWLSKVLPEFVAIPPRARTEMSEAGCQWVSMAQARDATLPEMPITLITAMKPNDRLPRILLERWRDEHQRWIRQFPKAEHIVTTRSGHGIPATEPELIVAAIRRLLPSTHP